MFTAIQTRFIPATNTKGSRIKAYSERGAVTVEYDYGVSAEQRHHNAAKAFAEKSGWKGIWVYGGAPDRKGDVYVLVATDRDGEIVNSALRLSPAFAFEVK